MMLLIRLWNCLTGYVIIKITGEYGERLLNSAALKKIYLWDIERKNSNELIVKVNVRDFFKLARLAKKTRSRVHILQRAGLFFIIIRLKKRKAFLFGVLIFVMAICIISLFIWDIEVRCEDEALGTSIIESLDRWGLKEGIFKHSIDKKYYLDRLLIEYNNVACEMEIKGSKLIVELVKAITA